VSLPVSVIIVTFNGKENLARCLASVYRQPYRPLDVVVVDNASSDGTPEMVSAEFPEARLVRNSVNRGFAGGNNDGVSRASADICILLNDDTEVETGWIPGLLSEFLTPNTGAVTSRVVTDGVPPEYYSMNGSVNYLGYNIMRVFHDLTTVFFAGGASLMFRRSDFETPFLEEYFLYHEDVFLSWLCRLRGLEVRMCQESVVRHRGGATTRKHPSRAVTFYQVRNRLLNLMLFYEARTLVALIPFLLADAAATFVHAAGSSRRSLSGVVRAWLWIARHHSWVRSARQNIQKQRTVPDRRIMSLMSVSVLEGRGKIPVLVNRVFRWYADRAGLAYYG
jgi:GT2 family glycosyltransferase